MAPLIQYDLKIHRKVTCIIFRLIFAIVKYRIKCFNQNSALIHILNLPSIFAKKARKIDISGWKRTGNHSMTVWSMCKKKHRKWYVEFTNYGSYSVCVSLSILRCVSMKANESICFLNSLLKLARACGVPAVVVRAVNCGQTT